MTTTPKIRVVLSTPDRMRFVCWLLGHTWRLEFAARRSGAWSER